jgi:putative RecB family exonuclease
MYRLENVEKAPALPAAWFMQGIAFHEAIEFWEKEGRAPTLEHVQDLFLDAWDNEQSRFTDWAYSQWLTGTPKRDGKADIEQRRVKGLQQVADYIEWANATAGEWRILTLDGEKALEIRFDMDLGVPGNLVRVVGYIDQIVEMRNGAIRPRDLKTGTKRPAWPVQLGVYALACRDVLNIDDVWHGDYYMCKDKGVTKPYDLRKFTKEFLTDEFHTLNEAIEAEIFMPNPGSGMCNVCGVWQWCRAEGPNAGRY